ncbi:oxidoreductase, short-chain dehydrogenase/reductase family [Talaromyces marneffei ATCC 18224]|uniref:Oxidoreductase, short-chain dehydrogenase/reductase family n=1 Tax=Talaromyces marneffei (strain ATCC 18224 / CBS 334.59 / QM 7333) TaxID=441960 RepID=B6Q2Q6_TALMQ|nr:oxidoreductase, short-chain dehydrogenase/reductase family [Talaromyces marneffei ATCC 18224]
MLSHVIKGHQIPVHHQEKPGWQHKIPGPKPVSDMIPTDEGGCQLYKAAGKLQGKRAVITGGDSGIGRAIAVLYAMEGASSLIVYLEPEEKDAQETKQHVEKYGAKCYLFPTDLRKKVNCKAVIDKAVEQLGGIDILVNNAAFQNMLPDIKDLSEEQWLKTFDTNIHPYFFLSKYALPHLKRGSTIINCASVNHYIGRGDLLDYTSTKGAIVAFTRALSNQQVGKGIRVNTVCPGPIWTPLIPSTMTTEAMEQFSGVPMGRPGQPSEVATCFVFLASADSSYMSGQSLHPNGGVVVGS